jgi:Protein of unknown function (DUF2934)
MQRDLEKIRQRAYEIWDREGRPDGRADDYWLQAERELAAAQANAPAGVKNAGIPAQAQKRGNGATTSAPVKSAATAPRKRRGSQPLTQG